jgi:hypothetical protein
MYVNDHKNVQIVSGSVMNWPLGSGTGIQDYGSERIFTDSHHCMIDIE